MKAAAASHMSGLKTERSLTALLVIKQPLIHSSILCLGGTRGRKGLAWVAYLFPPRLLFPFFFETQHAQYEINVLSVLEYAE